MKCLICRHGETAAGIATIMLTRRDMVLVVKGAPAEICDNCGEEYFDEAVTRRLLDTAKEAAASGVEVEVREYVAA